MPLTALLGPTPARSLTVRTALSTARREFDRGNWIHGFLMLGLVVLVRAGTVVCLPVRTVVGCRGDQQPTG